MLGLAGVVEDPGARCISGGNCPRLEDLSMSTLDSMGDKYGLGTPCGLHLAEMEGGAGDEALEVGTEVAGDMVGVVVGRVRSGWDTELVQTKLDNLDNFLWGNTGVTLRYWGWGWFRLGNDTETLP